jgi:hypothetical protein
MDMRTGVAAHLFWDRKVFLVLRDDKPGIVDPNHWDSVTETLESDLDGEDDCRFLKGMRRGLLEEINMVPARLHFLGLTKRGHGFFVGFLGSDELWRIRLGGPDHPHREGQIASYFSFPHQLPSRLGGSFRHHSEAYPAAFEKMARGILPDPSELGLRPVPAALTIAV